MRGHREARLLPLNELQKAYYVSRAAGTGTLQGFDGCQVYHSFEVRDLDVGRLEAAWLAWSRRTTCCVRR